MRFIKLGNTHYNLDKLEQVGVEPHDDCIDKVRILFFFTEATCSSIQKLSKFEDDYNITIDLYEKVVDLMVNTFVISNDKYINCDMLIEELVERILYQKREYLLDEGYIEQTLFLHGDDAST